MLEETDRVGKVRLEAAESCLDKIGNECKLMKTDRASCFKMVCSRITVFFFNFNRQSIIHMCYQVINHTWLVFDNQTCV